MVQDEKSLDLVNRQFTATRPNQLWVADLTDAATWRGSVYVAFVVDVFARYIVGAGVSHAPCTPILFSMPWSRLWARDKPAGLIHHSDRGSQYPSIHYTEWLAETGIELSVGSLGNSYDNGLVETINGLYKTKIIRRRGPWKNLDEVEYATLECVDWVKNRRILEPIGNIPPAEYELMYYQQLEESSRTA